MYRITFFQTHGQIKLIPRSISVPQSVSVGDGVWHKHKMNIVMIGIS